jgi:hypothetical protein
VLEKLGGARSQLRTRLRVKFPASRQNAGNFEYLDQVGRKRLAVKALILRGLFAEFPTQSCRELNSQI